LGLQQSSVRQHQVHPSTTSPDPPWTRERDAATGCYYFFNPVTGQSVWEEELEEGSSAVGVLASASPAAADDAGAHNEAEDDDEAEDALFLADRRGEARVQQVEAKTKHVMRESNADGRADQGAGAGFPLGAVHQVARA
jgi:hypothetical protein